MGDGAHLGWRRGRVQVHLEGNSLTRRAPQGAVGGWTLRMRGHPSLHAMGNGVDRTFQPAPGFLSLRHGLVTTHISRASPELPSEQRSLSWAPSLLCGPGGRGQSPGQGGISRAGRGAEGQAKAGGFRGMSAFSPLFLGGAVDSEP